MACACHKCICVISISIFSACLFKTPYFDCNDEYNINIFYEKSEYLFKSVIFIFQIKDV